MNILLGVIRRSFSTTFSVFKVPNHLECRRIQAPLVYSLIDNFSEEFGYDETIRIVRNMVEKDAIESGRALSQQYVEDESQSMFALEELITEVWCGGEDEEIMEIEVHEVTENSFHFDVLRCGYAEMYRELGIPDEIGCVLSCERDFPWCIGFDPNIILEREKTILSGDNICDFRYSKKKNN